MTSYPLSFFNNVKDGISSGGGMWSCLRALECNIISHQRTGSDPTDLIGLTGTMIGSLDLGLTGSQQVPFTWSYKMCYGPQAETKVLLWTVGSVTQNELGEPCPTLTAQTHTGVTTVTDGKLGMKFDDAYDGQDFNFFRYFVGDFKLSLTLPTASSPAAVSPTSSAISSSSSTTSISSLSSSQSSVTSNQTSTSTGSLGSIPPLGITWDGSQTQAASIGGPLPSQVPNQVEGSTNTGKIAGIAGGIAGGLLVLLLVVLILIRRRRRQNSLEEEDQGEEGIAPWMPENNHQPIEWEGTRNEKTAHLGMRNSHQPIVYTKPPPFNSNTPSESTGETSRSPEAPRPIEQVQPHTPSSVISGTTSPPQTVITMLPPSYDMHPYHQVVTPRVDDDDYSSVDDISLMDGLRDWAESHRDVIPTDLERRLRAGGFVPDTDPRELSRDVWERRFRVTPYELRGLQELYDMTHSASFES